MSTRSRIGIQNKDGSITSVYCHSDGYPAGGVGEMLVVHYTDEKKVKALMELGDMSSLGTEPISNPKAWETPGLGASDWMKAYAELHPENMCDTYASRGETCPAKTRSLEETIKVFNGSDQEYLYIFVDGTWFYIKNGETEEDLRPVAHDLDM